MRKKVTREVQRQRAQQAGFNPDRSRAGEEQVLKVFDPWIEGGYNEMWEVWTE
jgi:hypothetical protein